MRGETLEMSRRELDRVRVIGVVSEKRQTQRAAALELDLSVRRQETGATLPSRRG